MIDGQEDIYVLLLTLSCAVRRLKKIKKIKTTDFCFNDFTQIKTIKLPSLNYLLGVSVYEKNIIK